MFFVVHGGLRLPFDQRDVAHKRQPQKRQHSSSTSRSNISSSSSGVLNVADIDQYSVVLGVLRDLR